MTPSAITQYFRDTLEGLDSFPHGEDVYIYYDPERRLPHDGRSPFATIMTSDAYDHASQLNRPGVFRLNLGVSKETYLKLFGPPSKKLGGPEGIDTGHDYTALDRLMPHPVYAAMSWVSLLNPSDATFEEVRPLIKEAHLLAAGVYAKRLDGT